MTIHVFGKGGLIQIKERKILHSLPKKKKILNSLQILFSFSTARMATVWSYLLLFFRMRCLAVGRSLCLSYSFLSASSVAQSVARVHFDYVNAESQSLR